jgi:3-deoxy-D-manno-octulosonic-acid transferase
VRQADLNLRLYSLFWWAVLPIALLRLAWRGLREPGYWQHIPERLALYRMKLPSDLIWLHAVSVGETRAAEPLIKALLIAYPQHHILLTHMTATGRATGQALFANQVRLTQSFLPYDTLSMTRRFVAHFHPSMAILMETEVWPALVHACHAAEVPVALLNARLSERSLRRAQGFRGLLQEAAAKLSLVGAQTEADAVRLRSIGAPQVSVTGNLKFDVGVPPTMHAAGLSLRAQIGERPVLLCASTREGEEALLMAAYMKATLPSDMLLMIVPRHPQRFKAVVRLFEEQGLRVVRRSQLGEQSLPDNVQVLVGDSMGEMFAYYTACDLAFIGGSLLALGGQNLIEACACGKAVMLGPHTFNFSQISEQVIQAHAGRRVEDADDLLQQAFNLLTAPATLEKMSEQASRFAMAHTGATAKSLGLLAPLLKPPAD